MTTVFKARKKQYKLSKVHFDSAMPYSFSMLATVPSEEGIVPRMLFPLKFLHTQSLDKNNSYI